MIDGCKEMNFKVSSNKIIGNYKVSKEFAFEMPYSWENAVKFTSLQPSVMVAKANKILCNRDSWLQSHNKECKWLTFENRNLFLKLAIKS